MFVWLPLLQWCGTKPTVSPRQACKFIGCWTVLVAGNKRRKHECLREVNPLFPSSPPHLCKKLLQSFLPSLLCWSLPLPISCSIARGSLSRQIRSCQFFAWSIQWLLPALKPPDDPTIRHTHTLTGFPLLALFEFCEGSCLIVGLGLQYASHQLFSSSRCCSASLYSHWTGSSFYKLSKIPLQRI